MTSLVHDPAWVGDAKITSIPPQEEFPSGGEWPRLLVLGDHTSERLKLWLEKELQDHYSERGPLLDKWKLYHRIYWAEPKQKVRNFPFERASNFVVPLASIAVEAAYSRIMNTIFSLTPFYSLRPRNAEWVKIHKPFENYLQTEIEGPLDMYGFCNETMLDICKLGVGIGKSGYHREFKKAYRNFGGEDDEPYYFETHNSGTLERVPPENFLFRLNQTDTQTAPWVGERHTVTWVQIKKMAEVGRFDPESIDRIKHWWADVQTNESATGDPNEVKTEIRELADASPQWSEEFNFEEIWASFDVDEDGEDEEVVIDYHRPSRTILSIRYNWYDDLHRPYRYTNYIKVEGTWVGRGICKQTEQFQEEVTTIHRQRVDNATLANMTQVAIKKGQDYGPGEPIFPGKQWFLDNPSTDIVPFKLAEVYPSAYANEEMSVRLWEKSTGANEMILGIQQAGTPGTATGDLARIAEGNKRFDHVLKNVRRWLGRLGYDIVINYQQFGNQEAHWIVLGEKGEAVEQVFMMPTSLIRKGAVIELTVSDSVVNQELEQRKWLHLFQVLAAHYTQVVQFAQLLQDPGIFMQFAQRALVGSDEAMRRMLEAHDVVDTDTFTMLQETGQDETGIPTEESGPGGGGGDQGPEGSTGEGRLDGVRENGGAGASTTGGLTDELARSIGLL